MLRKFLQEQAARFLQLKSDPSAPKPGAATMSAEAIEKVLDVLAAAEDPDLVLKNAGLKRHDLRRLETDDEIFQALETRREAAVSTPWHLDPFDKPEHEWLWLELNRVLPSALSGFWDAVPYGYSVVETVYTPQSLFDPGKIGIFSSVQKPMEWFIPRYDGTLITQIPDKEKAEGDVVFKYVLTQRNAQYRNPYGEALLARAYWPWMFRTNGWRFWMTRLNRFADPLLVGNVEDPSAWVAKMKELGYEALVAVGPDEKVTPVVGSSGAEFPQLERAVSGRIQKLILGQTLTSDVGSSGSYAAAKVHNEVRDDKRTSDIKLLASSTQKIINALWLLNGLQEPPTFVMADDSGLETERAERDALLVQAGIIKLLPKYIVNKYDYEPDEFVMAEDTGPATKGKEPEPVNQSVKDRLLLSVSNRKTAQRFTIDQEDVEFLADSALDQAGSPIPPERIRELMEQAADEDTFVDLLIQEALDADPRELEQLIEHSLIAANVLGYVNAKTGRGV